MLVISGRFWYIVRSLKRKSEMQEISSKKLTEIVGSSSQVVDCIIKNVTTDSRLVRSGDLFIAIRGEKFDAHQFVPEVLRQGAALVLVEHIVDGADPARQVVVNNTTKAFGLIGAYNRSLFKGTVVGLTGSSGKTTTKEEIKFLLEKFGKVYATSGNFNNFIGVPRTLCDLDMDADFAVIEMGMSAKGEIAELVSYVQPDMAVITNVYPIHIEFFENFEGIAEAKAEIFQGLKKGGYALVNGDTNFAALLQERAEEQGAKVVTFGKADLADFHFETAQEGEHYTYNALCALKVVQLLGLDVKKAQEFVKDFGALDGRGREWKLHFSGGVYTLVDDSYSGQPEAMKLAIETLGKRKVSGRKVVVLGKMAELGETSQARHIEIGKVLAATDIDVAVGVCPEMKDMLAQLPERMETHYFENKEGLDEFLLNKLLQNNDIVLIKGARYSSKLYQVAESLIKQGDVEA